MLEIPKTLPSRIILRSKGVLSLSPTGLKVLATLLADSMSDPNIIEFFKRLAVFDDPFVIPLISVINKKTVISFQTTVNIFFRDGFNFVHSLDVISSPNKNGDKEQLYDFLKDDLTFFDFIGDEDLIVIELYDKKYLKQTEFNKIIQKVILSMKEESKGQSKKDKHDEL